MSFAVIESKTKLINKISQNKGITSADKKNHKGNIFKTRVQIQIEPESEHQKGKSMKLILRKQTNFFQKVDKFIEMDHIHSFMDQLCINQRTLKNKQNDQSILKTIFRLRTINMVQVNQNYVSLTLRSNKVFSHIPYIIQRFNSFGDNFFHSLALNLSKINETFQHLNLMKKIHTPQINPDVISRKQKQLALLVDSMKDKPFFIKMLPNQFLISKQFLKLIGRDMDQFAQQCIQYRVILDDFFTSDNYQFLLAQSFQMLGLFCKVIKGEISMQEMIDASSLEYIDTLRGKNDRRIKVRIKGFMPNAYSCVMLVDEVLGEEQMQIKEQAGSALEQKQKKNYLEEKVINNIKILKQLVPQQIKYLDMPTQKICKYKVMRVKNKKEDADYQI